jgi:hypothetical protein
MTPPRRTPIVIASGCRRSRSSKPDAIQLGTQQPRREPGGATGAARHGGGGAVRGRACADVGLSVGREP